MERLTKKIHVAREAPNNFPVVPLLSRGIQQGEVVFFVGEGGRGEGDFRDNFFFSVITCETIFMAAFSLDIQKIVEGFCFIKN